MAHKVKPAFKRTYFKPGDIVTPTFETMQEKAYEDSQPGFALKAKPMYPSKPKKVSDYPVHFGVVTETDGSNADVTWFGKSDLHNAWWTPSELVIVDNVIGIMINAMANPLGTNGEQGSEIFKK